MHVKSYYCHIKETDISYPKTKNDLAEKLINKPANKEIITLLDYPEPQKSCYQKQPQKTHSTNNLIKKTADIFISHRECADYKFTLKLRHDRIITTPGYLFEKSNLIEIKFQFINSILHFLQYDSNKHAGINVLKFYLVRKI